MGSNPYDRSRSSSSWRKIRLSEAPSFCNEPSWRYQLANVPLLERAIIRRSPCTSSFTQHGKNELQGQSDFLVSWRLPTFRLIPPISGSWLWLHQSGEWTKNDGFKLYWSEAERFKRQRLLERSAGRLVPFSLRYRLRVRCKAGSGHLDYGSEGCDGIQYSFACQQGSDAAIPSFVYSASTIA